MMNLEMYADGFKVKYVEFINGCDALEELQLWDKDAHGEMEAFYTHDLVGVILRLIVTDGSVSEKEVEYLNKTFGFSYDLRELTELYKTCEADIEHSFREDFENGITYMRKINTKLADAYKELLYLICEIIIASDGVVTEAELAELQRLKLLVA